MRLALTFKDVPVFLRILQSVAKVSVKSTIKFTPTDVMFIVTSTASEAGMQIWSIVPLDVFFDIDQRRIESRLDNEISFDVHNDTLLQALRSAVGANTVRLRLAKKGLDPVLSFGISDYSANGSEVQISQDVLVGILKASDIALIKEPSSPIPDVNIFLPKLGKMRKVVERMQGFSKNVVLSANWEGEVTLSIETDDIKINTRWKNLRHPGSEDISQLEGDERPRSAFRSVMLDNRSLHKLMSSYTFETTTIACICEDLCAVFYVYLSQAEGSGVMTFYMPAIEL